jgi:hypothetical protein
MMTISTLLLRLLMMTSTKSSRRMMAEIVVTLKDIGFALTPSMMRQ